MDDDSHPLANDDRLYALLNHYHAAPGEDRAAWLDRVMTWDGGSDADLTRWHGALLASAWIELNAGATTGVGPGRVPACYRVTPAGRQALKRARAARAGENESGG